MPDSCGKISAVGKGLGQGLSLLHIQVLQDCQNHFLMEIPVMTESLLPPSL